MACSQIPCSTEQGNFLAEQGIFSSAQGTLSGNNKRLIPYIVGHVLPVPSETGKSYGDLDEEYLTASYRVYMTEAEAQRAWVADACPGLSPANKFEKADAPASSGEPLIPDCTTLNLGYAHSILSKALTTCCQP